MLNSGHNTTKCGIIQGVWILSEGTVNAVLKHMAQMNVLTSCFGEKQLPRKPSPWGQRFVDRRQWEANDGCVNGEKGGGECVFPMVLAYEIWKKRFDKQLWSEISKNIYLSLPKLRRGSLRESPRVSIQEGVGREFSLWGCPSSIPIYQAFVTACSMVLLID
jgi:hypothetical protein